MKSIAKIMSLSALLLFLSGCATIVNNEPAKFDLQSDPTSAKVVVTDISNNKVVMNAQTPFSVTLDKKKGYFSGKTYSVLVQKEGFKNIQFDIKPTLSGWYICNVFFGGFLGWLIVDPISGGMWNLKPETSENVVLKKDTITIKLISDLNKDEIKRLQKIK